MDKKTYILEYIIHFNDGSMYEEHTMKIKNCMGELHAKIRLGDYLKKKHSNFKSLVIKSIKPDISNVFGDIFGGAFKDIFK